MFLDLNIDSKVRSNSRATPTRAFRITPAHHQTVFKPPFMTASALPLDFMTVESSTRWLPRRPKPSAQSQGGCAASGLTTGHQPQSFGRRQNGVLALLESRVTSQINLLRTLREVPENQQRNARRNVSSDEGTSFVLLGQGGEEKIATRIATQRLSTGENRVVRSGTATAKSRTKSNEMT